MGREDLKTPAFAIAIVVALALLAGCGGGSSSSSSASSNGDPVAQNPTAQFLKPKSPTNELVEFGTEAPAAERKAAEAVLAENLKARERGDFATQCATLATLVSEHMAEGKKKGAAAAESCSAELKKLAEPLSQSKPFRVDTLSGGTVSLLRVKGNQADAIYHGNDGKDYAMPMFKEGMQWKVAALLTTELNPPAERQKGPQPESGEPKVQP
jgi:hypothetical protein